MFLTDGGVPLSSDGLHVSVHGAQRAAESFIATPRGRVLMERLNRR